MTFLRPVNRSRRFRISVAGLFLFLFCFCSACGKQTSLEETAESPIQSVEESAAAAVEWSELTADGAVPVEDATLFQIATYPEGYRLITLGKEEQQEQYHWNRWPNRNYTGCWSEWDSWRTDRILHNGWENTGRVAGNLC